MSIGTGIAAGVANATQQAAHVADRRDKQARETQRERDVERVRFDEKYAATADAADTDEELPDHQAAGYERLYNRRGQVSDEAGDENPSDADAPPTRHIDITA